MIPKLSEGAWSLVLCLINENYTSSGEEISYFCVFHKSVSLLSGFNGVYEVNKYNDEDFQLLHS